MDSQRIRILINKGSRENRMLEMSLSCSRASLCSRYESTREYFSYLSYPEESLYSVEWNGGMEWWNGMVEWNSGMEWWNSGMTMPIGRLL